MKDPGVDSASVRVGLRLRELRLARGMSVRSLSEGAGFSPSFVSQVENGQASPSIVSLDRLAKTLGVALSAFFPEETVPATVIRKDDRRRIVSDWSRATLESLALQEAGAPVDAILLTLGGGGRSGSSAQTRSFGIFAYLLLGQVELVIAEDSFSLGPGDAVTIPANTPHLWVNNRLDPAELILVSASKGGIQ